MPSGVAIVRPNGLTRMFPLLDSGSRPGANGASLRAYPVMPAPAKTMTASSSAVSGTGSCVLR